jgi:hypothetical protein
MVCNPVARYCKVIILSSSERKVDLYRYQCNNLLLSSAIEDDWRVAKSPRVVLLRILEQMDQLHNLEYQVSILRLPASISRIGTATTVILSNRPGIWLPPFCDDCKERAPVRTAATRTVNMREQRMRQTKKMMEEPGEENRDR